MKKRDPLASLRKRKETDLKAAILKYLDTAGVTAWRNQAGQVPVGEHWMRLAVPGSSDIIGFRERRLKLAVAPGDESVVRIAQFVAVEVKRLGETLRPAQLAFLERVRAAGGVGIAAYCVEDVVNALRIPA